MQKGRALEALAGLLHGGGGHAAAGRAGDVRTDGGPRAGHRDGDRARRARARGLRVTAAARGRDGRRRAPGPLPRAAGALAALALLLGQLLCALAPAVAEAREGSMTVVSSDVDPRGYFRMNTDAGTAAYCISPGLKDPIGVTFDRWDYVGEATSVPWDAHAMAYLLWRAAPGNPLGFVRPDAATVASAWLLLGAQMDFDSGAVLVNGMESNLFEGPGGRCDRADSQRIQDLVAEARAHAGQAGPWDRASRIWYAPGGLVQSVVEVLPHGEIRLSKSSANHEVVEGNPCYSLAGAVYTVYSDEACTQAVATITTDERGEGSAGGLALGTYWLREAKAPAGFASNDEVIRVEVGSGEATRASATDVPQLNPVDVVLRKLDRETGAASPLGAATLEGAQFEVRYFAGYYDEGSLPDRATRTWRVTTGADGRASLADAQGDPLYRDSRGEVGIPVGTVAIREAKAPAGYLADGATRVVRVTPEGDAETISTYAAPTFSEQVMRGDLRFVKVAGEGKARLAGVPFLLTARSTGESHVVVSDVNGKVDTSSANVPHTSATNANDLAYDGATVDESRLDAHAGTWFAGAAEGGGAADDSLGALPFDTYRVEELPCSANAGLGLVRFEVTVDRAAAVVEGGTVEDEAGRRIGTSLTDEGGEHLVAAGSVVALVDEVSYENLVPGRTYHLVGTLMDRQTGSALLDDEGRPVTSESTFTPRLSSGEQDVRFAFDSSSLGGHAIVCFERLLDGEAVVASHEDLDDEGQTVYVPTIATRASDAEGERQDLLADGEVTVVDTVSYENLVPGRSYALTGTLMDKATGEAVAGADGAPVRATTEFTPEAPSGTATVTFRVDGSLVAGRTVVAFEALSREGREYAVHADIDDEDQTVSFPAIGTQASDAADGDKVVEAAAGQSVADEVAYRNLDAGGTYRLESRLLDAGSGEELSSASRELVAEGPDGTCTVELALDATGLEGRRLVCTEELYRGERLVARHADLGDEGQSVTVAGPEEGRPEGPAPTPRTGGLLPTTFDAAAPALGASLAALGMLLLVVAFRLTRDGA
ncbi:MAG: VaFE repeat-containing surface-anchored protein [Olsenella sp.]|jgi:hypothetical protein